VTPIGQSVLSDLNQTLDRLLNDDDEELRDGASNIVRKALGVSSPICRDRADELWCGWVREHLSELNQGDQQPWLEWLHGQTDLSKGSGHDSVFRPPLPLDHKDTALFAVEPANMFRSGSRRMGVVATKHTR